MKLKDINKWLWDNERSQEWLARQIKVSRSHLNQVLLGIQPLTDKMIKKIGKIIEDSET